MGTGPGLLRVEGRDENVTEFCLDEGVTYLCTLPDHSHSWSIPALDIAGTITGQTPILSVPPFTFRLVTSTESALTSLLSVDAYAGLNNTLISCSDTGGNVQQSTAKILGEMIPKHMIECMF